MNETPAIILNIQRQPGANVIDVVDRVMAQLPQLKASLPAAVDVAVLSDRTVTIRTSVRDVQFELALAIGAGGDGDLPVPAHAGGHDDPERGGAAVADRHLRRHVPGRLLDQQPDADGAGGRHRLRRRRRHRRDREHRALHRGRRVAAAGGAEGLEADRLHHHLADLLADRGADPAALHGRRGRPAVPRVRGHARGRHPDLRRGVADADADDVREAPAGTGRSRSAAASTAPSAPASTGWSPATAGCSAGCSTISR